MCRWYNFECTCTQQEPSDSPLEIISDPAPIATVLVSCTDQSQRHFGQGGPAHPVVTPPCLSQSPTTLVQNGFCAQCLFSRALLGIGPRPGEELVELGEQIAPHAQEFSEIFRRHFRNFGSTGIPEVNSFRLFDSLVRQTFDYVFLAVANLAFDIYLKETEAREQRAGYVYPNRNAVIDLWKHLGVVQRYNMVAEADALVANSSPPLPQLLEHVELSDLAETECFICRDTMGRRRERQEDRRAEFPCKTPCGHVFGYNCLYNWIIGHQNYNCPMCRATFSPTTHRFPDQDDGARMWLVILIQDINIHPTPPPTLPPARTPSLPPSLASSSASSSYSSLESSSTGLSSA